MRLLGEIFEKQRVHRALEPDVQLGDFAFGERDERHARELQMLVERRDIGLIARHAIERLGDNHIELACLRVGEQPLDAGTQDHAGARDRGILIGAFDLPPLARRAFAADALLVGDRRRTLLIGGIAGIERGADHDIFLWSRGKRAHVRLPAMTVSRAMPLGSTLPGLRIFTEDHCR